MQKKLGLVFRYPVTRMYDVVHIKMCIFSHLNVMEISDRPSKYFAENVKLCCKARTKLQLHSCKIQKMCWKIFKRKRKDLNVMEKDLNVMETPKMLCHQNNFICEMNVCMYCTCVHMYICMFIHMYIQTYILNSNGES